MEFGNFSDDLFEEATERPKKMPATEYKPKVLTPQWFLDNSASPDDDLDRVQFHVFQGDHHYYAGAWSLAADAYARALGYVAPNNPCMRRLLLESLARCRLRGGDAEGAVEMGEKLLSESTSENQLFTAHSAIATLYEAAGKIQEQIKSLQYCLGIRPSSVQHWIQLAKAHLKQSSKTSRKSLSKTSKPDKERCINTETDDSILVRSGQRMITNESEQNAESGCRCSQNGIPDGAVQSKHSQDNRRSAHSGLDGERCVCGLLSARDGVTSHSDPLEVRDLCQQNNTKSANKDSKNYECNGGSSAVNEEIQTREKDSSSGFIDGIEETARTLSLDERVKGQGQGSGPDSDADERERSVKDDDPVLYAATCLAKAKVILKYDQLSALSFAKTRNEELLCEVEELLQSLCLEPAAMEKIMDQASRMVSDKNDR